MEVIKIDGYTELEKLNIARNYLVAKQREANGLTVKDVAVPDDVLLAIIRGYTREAGVRNLGRSIGKIFRKIAHMKVAGTPRPSSVSLGNLREFLGLPTFRMKENEAADSIGLVTGLAWTETGGDLLDIEVAVLPGKGKLSVTGKLGDVMQESAQAALTYVRSRGELLGLDRDFYQHADIHIHVPEGAIPKDGPSAGITMATALVSALTGRAVRRDIAMTGEITLRGRILAIGGLKEKLLAARRGGVRTVLFPQENERDLDEIPNEVRESLEVIPVSHMDEVLSHAVRGYVELVRMHDTSLPEMGTIHDLPITSH
jgi:ATP-dependent Lon protease